MQEYDSLVTSEVEVGRLGLGDELQCLERYNDCEHWNGTGYQNHEYSSAREVVATENCRSPQFEDPCGYPDDYQATECFDPNHENSPE